MQFYVRCLDITGILLVPLTLTAENVTTVFRNGSQNISADLKCKPWNWAPASASSGASGCLEVACPSECVWAASPHTDSSDRSPAGRRRRL